jgi:hypothetical protein
MHSRKVPYDRLNTITLPLSSGVYCLEFVSHGRPLRRARFGPLSRCGGGAQKARPLRRIAVTADGAHLVAHSAWRRAALIQSRNGLREITEQRR